MAITPIIPTARHEAFDGAEWTSEFKFDGFRAICSRTPISDLARSRCRPLELGRQLEAHYPELIAAQDAYYEMEEVSEAKNNEIGGGMIRQ